MCEDCAQKCLKTKNCPSCRKNNFTIKPSILARRMIGAMPMDCPNLCGEMSTIGNINDHLKNCKNRKFICSSEECKFEGVKEDFFQHIKENHS